MKIYNLYLICLSFMLCTGCQTHQQVLIQSNSVEIAQRMRDIAAANPEKTFSFIREIQKAVHAGDAKYLAGKINFPIRTVLEDRFVLIETEEQFVANYSKIMDERVKNEILETREEDLIVNWRGVALASGSIWINNAQITYFDCNNRGNWDKRDSLEYLVPNDREIIEPLTDPKSSRVFGLLKDAGWQPEHKDSFTFEIYQADINNDGRSEYVITDTTLGSAAFSSINSVWTESERGQYKRLPLKRLFAGLFDIADSDFEWCDVQSYLSRPFLVRLKGKVYFGFENPPEYYLWEGEKIVREDLPVSAN
ncbi:hypothetical protein BVX94_02340 [bacterium B17]|nr:hypothetical protein BVX94_02340 [bacterium B17]